jgi:hypothetical protein
MSIVVAGFLFVQGPSWSSVCTIDGSHLRPRGMEMVQLTGATIRNVSRGVIGARCCSHSWRAGFLIVGVPGADPGFRFAVLGIIQIGPAILFLLLSFGADVHADALPCSRLTWSRLTARQSPSQS